MFRAIINSHKFSGRYNLYQYHRVPEEQQIEYDESLIPTFENEEFESRYLSLYKSVSTMKPMIVSIASHAPTLESMYMDVEVSMTLAAAKLDASVVFGLPTYKNLVYEFLASLVIDVGTGDYARYGSWKFRIQNKNFNWAREDAEELLGFPQYGNYIDIHDWMRDRYWKELTGQKVYDPSCASQLFIRKESRRYIHRLIGTGINCQPETDDTVTPANLDIMNLIDYGLPVNWFDIFSDIFIKMQDPHSDLKFVGCTSLITHIAQVCGFRFNCPRDGYRELDLDMMRRLELMGERPRKRTTRKVKKEIVPASDAECSSALRRSNRLKKMKEFTWTEVKRVTIIDFKGTEDDPVEIDSDSE